MKKLTILFAALTLSVGLWAIDGVKYIDANGQEQTANGVTEITNASSILAAGWYVVKGNEVTTGSLTCSGAVHLILADGAKLTATGEDNTPGIQVSGEGNSLTIYGQANQSGQLIATGGRRGAGIGGGFQGSGSNITINGGVVTAIGGEGAAGIGGGSSASGSNITINGGMVTATGGNGGAGIGGGSGGSGSNITINGGEVKATSENFGAGIGGGGTGNGSNITINGGKVIATGEVDAAGIGGGSHASGSNITITGGDVTATSGKYDQTTFGAGIGNGGSSKTPASDIKVATTLIVKAGATENPTEEIENDGGDIANDLAGKQYVTIKISLSGYKAAAIEEIELAIVGVTDENILGVADKAKEDINKATTKENIDAIKTFALTKINALDLIQTARQGIQNTEINKMIDGAFNDILRGGPDAKPGIEEILEQIMTIIQSFQIGKEEGQAETAAAQALLDALPTEEVPGVQLVVTKTVDGQLKQIVLMNPDKVEYLQGNPPENHGLIINNQ